jgi:hypothetical protein
MKLSMSKSALALAAAGLLAFAPGAFAWGHGHGYGGGYRGGYGGYHGGYYGGRGHYDSGGRWIAGAIVAGVVGGAIYSATRPVYYDQPVVYSRPVVYERPVVIERTTYVRDDGYYGN